MEEFNLVVLWKDIFEKWDFYVLKSFSASQVRKTKKKRDSFSIEMSSLKKELLIDILMKKMNAVLEKNEFQHPARSIFSNFFQIFLQTVIIEQGVTEQTLLTFFCGFWLLINETGDEI